MSTARLAQATIKELIELLSNTSLSEQQLVQAQKRINNFTKIAALENKQQDEQKALVLEMKEDGTDCSDILYPTVSLDMQYQVSNRMDTSNNANYTALTVACENGHLDVVRMLLAAGANPNTTSNWNSYMPSFGTAHGTETPLCISSAKGHKEIVKLLLTVKSLDPNLGNQTVGHRNRGAGDDNPLAAAIVEGHQEIAHALITDPRIDLNKTWQWNEYNFGNRFYSTTHIDLAIDKNQLFILNLLLQYGSPIKNKEQLEKLLTFLIGCDAENLDVMNATMKLCEILENDSKAKETKDVKDSKQQTLVDPPCLSKISNIFAKIDNKLDGIRSTLSKEICTSTSLPSTVSGIVAEFCLFSSKSRLNESRETLANLSNKAQQSECTIL